MANYIIDGTLLTNIATAIRNKKGVASTYTPAEMATAINGLAPKTYDNSGTITFHSAAIMEAWGDTIPAGETKGYKISTGADTYLDFSNIALVMFNITCSQGTAYVSKIDLVNNEVVLKAGDASNAQVTFLNVEYVDLKIV